MIMALGMVSTLVFHVDHYGVALLSKVEPGLPKFIIPSVFHVDLKHAAGRGLMIAVVVMAKTIGCVLPLAAKKIGLDPAIMAAPLITTIVDTCSIIIYFAIATHLFAL